MRCEKREISKKRILFLSNHFITLFSFRKELINSLLQDGHEIYISTPKDEDNVYFRNLGCKIIETPIDRRGVNPVKDLKTIYFYYRIIKKFSPDIIFSYTIKPNIYGSMISNFLGVKQVCNITGTGATFLKDSFLSKIAKLLYKISVKKAYKIFFQNSGDRDFFVSENMIGDNWELIPGSGVNLDLHRLTPYPQEETISFIFIGRVMALKGIDEFLSAAKYITEKYKNTKFYIAGWNEDDKYIEKIKVYQECGYIEYVGFQKNIDEWIDKCHCTILPSHGGEGVPNVLLESAAHGRGCIASSIPGSMDVIDDEKTGYIFAVGDSNSLIEKIEKFISLSWEEKRDMGLYGRRKVEKEFDRQIVVEKYLKEINIVST